MKANSATPGVAGAGSTESPVALRLFLAALMMAFFLGLGLALMSLPEQAPGLKDVVAGQMAASGVSHPVTAVLLNFRGYDTLLEMAVLLLALIAVWSLSSTPSLPLPAPGMVLDRLVRLYTPLMFLVAGYLLWNGAHAPGGAFQAGAVLAAAGVLLVLAGRRLPAPVTGWPLRLAIILGVGVFSLVAAALSWRFGVLLAYPRASAGSLILLIESAATLSIGITLTALFLGERPGAGQ